MLMGLISASLFFGAAQILRYFRWRYLLSSIPAGYISKTFSGFIFGQFFNIFVPFKIGDLIRAGMSSSGTDSFLPIFTTLVAERSLDGLYLFLILHLFLGFNGFIIYLLGASSFAILIIGIFGTILFEKIAKSHDISNYGTTFVTASILQRSLKKGFQKKVVSVTILMWLCNGVAICALSKSIYATEHLNSLVKSLYLRFNPPISTLDTKDNLCIFFSIVVAILIWCMFRKKIESFWHPKDKEFLHLGAGRINFVDLAVILNQSKSDERLAIIFKGGSGAVTALIEKISNGSYFVRKLWWKQESNILHQQYDYIKSFNNNSIIKVSELKEDGPIIRFDMPYLSDYRTFTKLLMTSNYSKIEQLTSLVLKNHHELFNSTDGHNSKPVNWDLYLNNRANPAIRIMPILEDYLLTNPSEQVKIFELFLPLQRLHKKLLSEFSDPEGIHILTRSHGDFSSENIMIRNNSEIIFIDLVRQSGFGSMIDDLAKLYFSLMSGFDATLQFIESDPNYLDGIIGLPRLTTKNSLTALETLEEYLLSRGGKNLLTQVRILAFTHLIRVMPYRLKDNAKRTIQWLEWSNNFASELQIKI